MIKYPSCHPSPSLSDLSTWPACHPERASLPSRPQRANRQLQLGAPVPPFDASCSWSGYAVLSSKQDFASQLPSLDIWHDSTDLVI